MERTAEGAAPPEKRPARDDDGLAELAGLIGSDPGAGDRAGEPLDRMAELLGQGIRRGT